METPEFDLEFIKKKALEQFRSGKSLYGKEGAFAPLLKHFLEAALQAELEGHLDEEERNSGNRKNGKGQKQLKTSDGTLTIETPRDRTGTFEPELIRKRETILAESLESKILGMYGLGMSFRDISKHIKDMYDTDISHATLSAITDKILPQIKEWQSRPLEELYTIVWLDAMHYKVKEDNRVVSRAVYNILGINRYGKKELLGMYVSQSEGANFWLGVLTDLKNRGVSDILIACIDNLKGFAEAINAVFTETEVQTCIVHQIRNSLKYVASKDQKEFMKDLKPVYQAVNKDLAELRLEELEEKWGRKYPVVLQSWRHNWEKLSTYFKYDVAIRRLIYTTNTIEGFHRQVRKVTKTKGAFTSDTALIKLIYLAHGNISQKWTMPLTNWAQTASHLAIWFDGRMKLDLN
ncbi:IS256 family transposase [Solitalea canadensis]|uniref:Mutator family transposase n=1 Tax=Solitalea canadensis (strain ATCC 29591 / DSM 3403 / JCM 21819 / LMG 8368 / NBRC 15130 / NCIMB 12057 / USAM 9D) TaxID=929556 RepID=H1PI23_SOLCM|nr:IS256 family transposase [Solitalea canadensis]AFD07808.1 transposase [Solitalea canadensis DSM 3403]AFD08147.1 transposase [Solitalea canadensis DSM 3403]AFD08273.1 transposase [Solitalea canadensis DSM 3403]AFD09056.1 transposase [Solitalea canadensis DSM 3403]